MKTAAQTTIKKNSYWFEIILVTLIVSFTILTIFAKNYLYFPFDLVITQVIQLISVPFFKEIMLGITSLGYVNQGAVLICMFALIIFLLGKSKESLMLIISSTGAVLLSLVFKLIVARPRPDPSLIHQLSAYQSADSFPSGHVLFFMGFFGYLLYLAHIYLYKGSIKIITETILIGLIILMGISRIYVGAHWFSDTLGAYLIGSVWLLFIVKIRPKLIDFLFKKSE
jgi:undecaprenyl-diphosphatase